MGMTDIDPIAVRIEGEWHFLPGWEEAAREAMRKAARMNHDPGDEDRSER